MYGDKTGPGPEVVNVPAGRALHPDTMPIQARRQSAHRPSDVKVSTRKEDPPLEGAGLEMNLPTQLQFENIDPGWVLHPRQRYPGAFDSPALPGRRSQGLGERPQDGGMR